MSYSDREHAELLSESYPTSLKQSLSLSYSSVQQNQCLRSALLVSKQAKLCLRFTQLGSKQVKQCFRLAQFRSKQAKQCLTSFQFSFVLLQILHGSLYSATVYLMAERRVSLNLIYRQPEFKLECSLHPSQ